MQMVEYLRINKRNTEKGILSEDWGWHIHTRIIKKMTNKFAIIIKG